MRETNLIWVCLLVGALQGCVTWNAGNDVAEPPQITNTMLLSEALQAGIDFGDKTLVNVKKEIKERKQWTAAEEHLYEKIMQNYARWPAPKVINALNLYQSTSAKRSPELFKTLSRADSNFVHQVAWHLAASQPSREMAREIESKLTEAISENDMEDLFWPKMAEAVANNRLVQSYTVVRRGLFASNHVAFARAMIALNPRRASFDFMEYLAQAPAEELRQLTLTSVDVFSCMEILQHYLNFPVTVSHPEFEHLFFYAISRNTALAEMTRKVLESYLPRRNEHLAFVLARMPSWVQVAFVEGSRRQMTPLIGVFLRQLKKTTSQQDVVEEIDNVVR